LALVILPKFAVPTVNPGVAQVRMVQDIEKFRAELQPVPLRYRERLIDRKVPVKRTRTEHGSISEVARRVRRGSGERRRVEPQVQTRDRYRLGTSKVIGARVTLARVQGIAGNIDRHGAPALTADDARHVPAAQQYIGRAAARHPAAAASKGQLVHYIGCEPLAQVVGRVALLT